jgi:hypothetical protein
MKEPPIFSFASFREQSRRRKLQAAVRKLPVYEFERFGFTDAANVPPINSTGAVKVRPSWLVIRYRWLRLRLNC